MWHYFWWQKGIVKCDFSWTLKSVSCCLMTSWIMWLKRHWRAENIRSVWSDDEETVTFLTSIHETNRIFPSCFSIVWVLTVALLWCHLVVSLLLQQFNRTDWINDISSLFVFNMNTSHKHYWQRCLTFIIDTTDISWAGSFTV